MNNNTIPKSEWVWYGYAGHLCVSRRCAYHLCTRIGRRLVSTIGAFYPDGPDSAMERIGGGERDYFETYVFVCDEENEHGDPNWSGLEIERQWYATSIEAERGHREICDRIAREQ